MTKSDNCIMTNYRHGVTHVWSVQV